MGEHLITIESLGLSVQESDFLEISLVQLAKYKISPAHIFLKLKKAGPLLILQAGDPILKEFLEKYKKKKVESFWSIPLVDVGGLKEQISQLEKLKDKYSEQEKEEARRQLVNWFYQVYWKGSAPGGLLDLVFLCTETYLRLDQKILQEIQEASLLLYGRSLKVASFAIFTALSLGYMDHEFLSDLFNVALLLDYGLIGPGLSTFVFRACELERSSPGDGVDYLDELDLKGEEVDVKFFLDHPKRGKLRAVEKCEKSFRFPECLGLIERHHEFGSAFGFPVGLEVGELTEFEKISIFVDSLVPYADSSFAKGDGKGAFFKSVEQCLAKNVEFKASCQRILNRLKHEYSSLEKKVA